MEELINPFKQNSKQELINPFKSSLKEKELPKKEIKSSVKELGLGFVSGFDNPFYTAAGKINTTLNKIPGVNIPMPPMEKLNMGQGLSYNIGKNTGEASSYIAPMLLPETLLGRVGVGAAYGAATGDDTIKGALKGAVGQGFLEAIPALSASIKYSSLKAVDIIRPKKYLAGMSNKEISDVASNAEKRTKDIAGSILNKLDVENAHKISEKEASNHLDKLMFDITGGAGSKVENITKSIMGDIQGSFKNKLSEYKVLKNEVMSDTGKDIIYPADEFIAGEDSPLELKANAVHKKYNSVLRKTLEDNDVKFGNAVTPHNNFLKNPTFENADNLRQYLGERARSISGIEKSSHDQRNNLYKIQNELTGDLTSFLNKKDPSGDLAKKYLNTLDFYKKEVSPYKVISDITYNKGDTSSHVLSTFKNPELFNYTDETGKSVSPIEKISNDLGEKSRGKIIALDLAKKTNLTPDKALDAYKNLDTSSLGRYNTENLDSYMRELGDKVNKRNVLKEIKDNFYSIDSPEKLSKVYGNLDTRLKKYFTPEMDKKIDELNKSIIDKDAYDHINKKFSNIKSKKPEKVIQDYENTEDEIKNYIPETFKKDIENLKKKVSAKSLAKKSALLLGLGYSYHKLDKLFGGN
jgi:hypothetical protein